MISASFFEQHFQNWLQAHTAALHLRAFSAQETEAHERTEQQLLVWERENAAIRAKLDDAETAVRNERKKVRMLSVTCAT